jgi:hypothetical protein
MNGEAWLSCWQVVWAERHQREKVVIRGAANLGEFAELCWWPTNRPEFCSKVVSSGSL